MACDHLVGNLRETAVDGGLYMLFGVSKIVYTMTSKSGDVNIFLTAFGLFIYFGQ